MTPEEQLAAIAKEDGWEFSPTQDHASGRPWLHVKRRIRIEELPDYLNNLNAILPVIRKIPPAERDQYQNIIWHICDKLHRMTPVTWLVTTAEAHQHCEAFLRLKKLWKD